MGLLGTLLLTHSSRRLDSERCSSDFLRRRFGAAERLRELPPVATLPPARALYSGALSIYRVHAGEGTVRLERAGAIKHRDKIQHAVARGTRELVVAFEHRLERWRLPRPLAELERLRARDVEVVARLEHPHLAGIHTVDLLDPHRAVVSCAAADAVLIIDLETHELRRTLRLPAELYGRGYRLDPALDLRRHYVDDEQQTTHVNAATVVDDGRRVLVSTLIQGAVGSFELEGGGYRELARGFIGCHGARADDRGRVYFCDSPRGDLIFLDPEGVVAGRIATGSRWLHDAVQLRGSLYAFALADQNALEIYDLERERPLVRRHYFTWPIDAAFSIARRLTPWLGNSVQALSFAPGLTDQGL